MHLAHKIWANNYYDMSCCFIPKTTTLFHKNESMTKNIVIDKLLDLIVGVLVGVFLAYSEEFLAFLKNILEIFTKS